MYNSQRKPYRIIKVIFELLVVIVFLPIWLILFLIVGGLVRVKMGAPILFTQPRGGINGSIFKLYKFRTMLNTVDDNGALLSDNMRLTKFGKWLRSSSLDELPSLFNFFKGDMAIIGPRPFISDYLPLYNKSQQRRHEVKPGITGWAQVNGRNAISWKQKFELDVWYVDNVSLSLDFKILWLTGKKVVVKEGISSETSETMEKFKGN